MNKDYLDKLILDFEEDVSNLALGKKANKKGFIGFTELEKHLFRLIYADPSVMKVYSHYEYKKMQRTSDYDVDELLYKPNDEYDITRGEEINYILDSMKEILLTYRLSDETKLAYKDPEKYILEVYNKNNPYPVAKENIKSNYACYSDSFIAYFAKNINGEFSSPINLSSPDPEKRIEAYEILEAAIEKSLGQFNKRVYIEKNKGSFLDAYILHPALYIDFRRYISSIIKYRRSDYIREMFEANECSGLNQKFTFTSLEEVGMTYNANSNDSGEGKTLGELVFNADISSDPESQVLFKEYQSISKNEYLPDKIYDELVDLIFNKESLNIVHYYGVLAYYMAYGYVKENGLDEDTVYGRVLKYYIDNLEKSVDNLTYYVNNNFESEYILEEIDKLQRCMLLNIRQSEVGESLGENQPVISRAVSEIKRILMYLKANKLIDFNFEELVYNISADRAINQTIATDREYNQFVRRNKELVENVIDIDPESILLLNKKGEVVARAESLDDETSRIRSLKIPKRDEEYCLACDFAIIKSEKTIGKEVYQLCKESGLDIPQEIFTRDNINTKTTYPAIYFEDLEKGLFKEPNLGIAEKYITANKKYAGEENCDFGQTQIRSEFFNPKAMTNNHTVLELRIPTNFRKYYNAKLPEYYNQAGQIALAVEFQ